MHALVAAFWQFVTTPLGTGIVGSLVTTFVIGAWMYSGRLLKASLEWLRSLRKGVRANPIYAPNIRIVSCKMRRIGLSKHFVWERADIFDEGGFRTAFVAEFTNQALEKHQVGRARNVRAKVTLTAGGISDRGINSDPAPWLYANHPAMPFDVGETRELILGVVDHLDLTSPSEQPDKPLVAICGLRDLRDKTVTRRNSYDWSVGLIGPVLAKVTLTVDGLLNGPTYIDLNPGDPATRQPPSCSPGNAPRGRLAARFQRLKAKPWRLFVSAA
jgi:hypothetical protein